MCQFDVAVEDKDVVKLAQKISENGATFEKEYAVHTAALETVAYLYLADIFMRLRTRITSQKTV
jgi:formate dehydrogenase assembly factor FdhD